MTVDLLLAINTLKDRLNSGGSVRVDTTTYGWRVRLSSSDMLDFYEFEHEDLPRAVVLLAEKLKKSQGISPSGGEVA